MQFLFVAVQLWQRNFLQITAQILFSLVGGIKFLNISKKGSTPTPWARGRRDQIPKWALETQKTLYF